MLICLQASLASDDENTIKVAPKKDIKGKQNGSIKLKKPAPKHNKPGNWRDGSVIDGEQVEFATLATKADSRQRTKRKEQKRLLPTPYQLHQAQL